MTRHTHKNKKCGGARLISSFRALGAVSRNARNKQLFSTAAIAHNGSDAVTESGKKKQPSMELDVAPIDHYSDIGKHMMRGKIDIRPTMLQTSNGTKVVIAVVIAAFLSMLLAKKELTHNAKDLLNKTTDDVYRYMVKTASDTVEEWDTTIIASIYTVWRRLSSDTRKNMLKKLVIDGTSYGWLAEYDVVLDIWLNKLIEIKGGELPSDKHIIDIVNIIQSKILPVTNGIWYFNRAIRLHTGLGITEAYAASDSFWYTSKGKMETAIGVRQMLTYDTMLAKIIIGLLTVSEMVSNMFESSFDIKMMLKKIIIKFKSDLRYLRKKSVMNTFKTMREDVVKDVVSDIKMRIIKLQELEEKLDNANKKLNQPYMFPQRILPVRHINPPTNITDINDTIRNMGAFDLYHGGERKKYRGYTRRRACNSRRRSP